MKNMMKQINIRIPLRVLTFICGLFLSVGAFAQIAVKGHVKDDAGEPIMGAAVRVVGQPGGVVTDFDGNFSISAPKGAQLTISFMGFQTATVAASPVVNVVLQEDQKLLEDVVVIGYGTAKKNDLTGSVTVVKPDEQNHGVITTAQEMMQGKIAGVNIVDGGGAPGGGATIRIRGGSSLNASNDPLIVIDGLAIDNNGVKGVANLLSIVNPADIESFTVLKDASATAIYGSRGSNGVIIITTKKGAAGSKVKVTYNGSVNIDSRKKSVEVMDGNQFRQFVKDWYGDTKYNELYTKGWIGDANTDWQDEIYRTAVSSDHNITIQGGTKHMPYRASIGYTGDRGILKTSEFRRTTASFNLSPSVADDHLKINLTGKYMFAESRYPNTGAVGAAIWMNPTVPVRSDDPRFATTGGYWQWLKDGSPQGADTEWLYTLNSQGTKNPVSLLNLKRDEAGSHDFMGNAEFDYSIHHLEDLHLHVNLGGEFATGKQDTKTSPYSPDGFYFGWDGWDKIVKYNLQLNTYAQYSHNWNRKHEFNIMAGYEYQRYHRKQTNDGWGAYPGTNVEHGADAYADRIMNRIEPTNGYSTYCFMTENFVESFMGRANYTLLNRYLFSATFRADGSSRFYDHWATFPSFAFAWRINEEKFLKDAKNLSQLKLRLGWGKTGQQDGIADYGYFATYSKSTSSDGYYDLVGDGTIKRPNVYNTLLKWETTTTSNVGIDFGLWNNRLSISADYYYRETTDLINTVDVSAGSNFRNTMTGNIGSLKNTGFELQATAVAIDKKDWTWELGFNATYNKNEITKSNSEEPVPTMYISSGTGNYVGSIAVGHPSSAFYVYQQVYDENGLPINGVFVDRDGDGQITQSDRYWYKQAMAPWTMGFSSKLRYKRWDLGFSLRASIGNYVWNDSEAGMSNLATVVEEGLGYVSNRATYELPKAWTTWLYNPSDYFVQNASFLKCDNITLGYSWPGATRHKISGRVYASVSNVFCITKYKGIDPEVGGGVDNNIYPRPIKYQVGINLNF